MNINLASIRKSQLGATLVESLVALFVFSIGALGLAALQTASFLQNDDAGQRSIAVWKAQELTDRILSTRSFANGTDMFDAYVAAIGAPIANIGVYGDGGNVTPFCQAGAPGTDCNAEVCDANELVNHDLFNVFCDPQGGVIANPAAGITGLIEPDVVLRQNGGAYELYLEWVSRNASSRIIDDDGDGQEDGVQLLTSNLCGNPIALDRRVNAICVGFQ